MDQKAIAVKLQCMQTQNKAEFSQAPPSCWWCAQQNWRGRIDNQRNTHSLCDSSATKALCDRRALYRSQGWWETGAWTQNFRRWLRRHQALTPETRPCAASSHHLVGDQLHVLSQTVDGVTR